MVRHARITSKLYQRNPSPPFLILFVNSVCNMKCEHCFYWRNLNSRDDLSTEELLDLSRSLGTIENLSLSGGEPFLRKDLARICHQFIRHNSVRQIYVPSNGYFTGRTVKQVRETLSEPELDLFVVELSLDGMPDFHDAFRGVRGAFNHALETYDALARLQTEDPRLRIHAASTATNQNIGQIERLTTFLFHRCPQMDHHNLAIIRGDRKNPSLLTPDPQAYRGLYEYIRRLWLPRESSRYGAIVEPMTQWAKLQNLARQTQVIPCAAGKLSAVVYANGDVSLCELHAPLGNLRQRSFPQIWASPEARQQRVSIGRKECHCTTEVFLWPSIVFRPASLVQAMVGARVWRKVEPLSEEDQLEGTGYADFARPAVPVKPRSDERNLP
jgi:MoaA/NifB/PqqE/SkfB family radical SAM enzyme